MANYSVQRAELGIGTRLANIVRSSVLRYEAGLNNNLLDHAHQFATLAQRISREAEFNFLAITDNQGTILYHSNEDKINKKISIEELNNQTNDFSNDIKLLLPDVTKGTNWGFVEIDENEYFVVHWALSLENNELRKAHVFVAFNSNFMKKEIKFYSDNIMETTLLVLGLGLVSLWIFTLVFRVYISKKRMKVATELIEDMDKEMQWLKTEVQKHEKLSAMSSLAAGVAHELRNPLSSIKGYATYFSNQFPDGSTSQDAAKIMMVEVERLNKVIKDLINVSQPIGLEQKIVSIQDIINATIALLAQDAMELGVRFIVTGKDQKAPVDADRLKQAFLNILLNALEAFKENDYIKSMTQEPYIKIHLAEGPSMIKIQIKNNACPIDSKDIKRIFDPYFTTKSEGTGLGLIMTTKIIESHGGSIVAQSHKDIGTLFTIQLPKVFKE